MCDYSLEHLVSREAAVADRLVSTRFRATATRGFALPDDRRTAVCLRPGTEVVFDMPPRYRPGYLLSKRAPSRGARFRQINGGQLKAHHDALEFADGTIVPVTQLLPGQKATVLQLPVSQPAARNFQDEPFVLASSAIRVESCTTRSSMGVGQWSMRGIAATFFAPMPLLTIGS